MNSSSPPKEKIKERIILLKRFFGYYLEGTWENEIKNKIYKEILKAPPNKTLTIEDIATSISDQQLETMFHLSPLKTYYTFKGKYYTVSKEGILKTTGSQDEIKNNIKYFLQHYGKKGYALLKALLEVKEANFETIAGKTSEIYGEKIYPTRLIAELKDRWELVWKTGSNRYPKWKIPEEIRETIAETLAEFEKKPIPKLSTKEAQNELLEVEKMEEEFTNYLHKLLKERLDKVLKFGTDFSPSFLVNYLKNLFGESIFFDHLLAITQQYSICDTEVINKEGEKTMTTGFNLALFGEPGTGKTFATKDMILGNNTQGIPSHGLPGLNRYCGGMTPTMFISIGEAYQGRKFNFIITEFNEWFKYKGMVEPLKIAMERGTIRYETKTYKVGPYNFTSFFTVNYNTKVYEKGYEVTISDPNFNAIEDRMLCRLHRLTKEKYEQLSKSQRELILGNLKQKMHSIAPLLKDHLTLLYAIQTKHHLTPDKFKPKRILITDELFDKLQKARELILKELNSKIVPFSPRLEKRAIQLAAAMSLINYFRTSQDIIPIDKIASQMAIQFFIEEAWIRSKEKFQLNKIFEILNIK